MDSIQLKLAFAVICLLVIYRMCEGVIDAMKELDEERDEDGDE